MRTVFTAYLSLITILFSAHTYSFEAFDVFKIYLFSAMEGQVLDNGTPVEGALVTRTASESRKEVQQTTTTDKNGNFSFKAWSKFGFTLLSEVRISQHVFIDVNDTRYLGWKYMKTGEGINTEFNPFEKNVEPITPISCVFDIAEDPNSEQKLYLLNDGNFYEVLKGLCKLKNINFQIKQLPKK